MLLERVEIVGFRGINRLSLQLEQNNVLIGENAWGKSSLLDALTLLLSPEDDLYHFVSGSRRRRDGAREAPAYYPDVPRIRTRASPGASLPPAVTLLGAVR
jgi:ABC-type multidrug transport system ATPase subunit